MRSFGEKVKNKALRYLKNAFLRPFYERDTPRSLAVLAFSSLLLHALFCTVLGHARFLGLYHLETADLFGDFFAALHDAAKGAAAYSERGVIYPPLSNLLLRLLARFLPTAYLTEANAASWRQYNAAILLYLLFFVCLTVLLFLALRHFTENTAASLALTLSFPVFFLLERGNVLLTALLPLLAFVRYFDSECAWRRELSLFALALSAALKLYPLSFGVLLLPKRRFRALLRVFCYTAGLFLLPSFAFGGPMALWLMVKNAARFTATGQNAVHFFEALGVSPRVGTLLLALFYALLFFVLLLLAFRARLEKWQLSALCAASLLCFSSVFSAYNWLLFLPSLLALFEKKCQNGIEWLCFFIISAPFFLYLPKRYQDPWLIVLLLLLFAAILLPQVRRFWKREG